MDLPSLRLAPASASLAVAVAGVLTAAAVAFWRGRPRRWKAAAVVAAGLVVVGGAAARRAQLGGAAGPIGGTPLAASGGPSGSALPRAPGAHPYPLASDNPSIAARTRWRIAQLTSSELDAYARDSVARGRALFTHVFTEAEGLGPYFNDRSCAACHNVPALLGHGRVDRAARVYGTGRTQKDHELPTKLLPYNAISGQSPYEMPPGFHHLGDRIPPPLLGLGWVEVVEGEQILARPHCESPEPAPDHVCGWAPRRKIGMGTPRFGLKMNVATLEEFIAGALALEMGILTEFPIAPTDPPPVRPELPNLAVIDLANFIAFSPAPAVPVPPERAAGARVFEAAGCKDCHWSSFEVGGKPTPQMYSDLLAHDMGKDRAEADFDHLTPPAHYRTTPLWGLRDNSGPYLHEGAAATLDEAVLMHAGEAAGARDKYRALDTGAKEELLQLLRSL